MNIRSLKLIRVLKDDIKKEDIENLMHVFKTLHMSNGKSSLNESRSTVSTNLTASLNQKKLNKVSISDCLKCYENKIRDEIVKLK